jgi:hypothetical protein
VLVNGTIMTVYLWHLTVMVLVIGLGILLGGVGLGLPPGSAAWWATRPLWMGLLTLGLIPCVAIFGRLERASGRPAGTSAWRLVLGATMVCGGLASIALDGIGADGPLGIRWAVVALAFLGAAIARVRPFPRREPV